MRQETAALLAIAGPYLASITALSEHLTNANVLSLTTLLCRDSQYLLIVFGGWGEKRRKGGRVRAVPSADVTKHAQSV